MTRIFALAFLLTCSVAANAHEGMSNPVERLDVKGIGRLEYQHLFTETSQDGENLDAFVVRIAPRLLAYSEATGLEACGVLAKDGERYGVKVGSNRAHAVCVNMRLFLPEGMTSVAQTLHSHPSGSSYRVNAQDRLFLGMLTPLRSIQERGRPGFSPEDFSSGAGLGHCLKNWSSSVWRWGKQCQSKRSETCEFFNKVTTKTDSSVRNGAFGLQVHQP